NRVGVGRLFGRLRFVPAFSSLPLPKGELEGVPVRRRPPPRRTPLNPPFVRGEVPGWGSPGRGRPGSVPAPPDIPPYEGGKEKPSRPCPRNHQTQARGCPKRALPARVPGAREPSGTRISTGPSAINESPHPAPSRRARPPHRNLLTN